MEEEMKDTLIHCEKEKELKFNLSFKLVLGISIFLTGLLTFSGFIFTCRSIIERDWLTVGVTSFLGRTLFYISVLICLISLISIAVIKRPFSKILAWCFLSVGIVFVAASFIFPRIPRYETGGFKIFDFGKYTLIDGIYFVIGLLGILFSRIIHYGFIYQKDADMTV